MFFTRFKEISCSFLYASTFAIALQATSAIAMDAEEPKQRYVLRPLFTIDEKEIYLHSSDIPSEIGNAILNLIEPDGQIDLVCKRFYNFFSAKVDTMIEGSYGELKKANCNLQTYNIYSHPFIFRAFYNGLFFHYLENARTKGQSRNSLFFSPESSLENFKRAIQDIANERLSKRKQVQKASRNSWEFYHNSKEEKDKEASIFYNTLQHQSLQQFKASTPNDLPQRLKWVCMVQKCFSVDILNTFSSEVCEVLKQHSLNPSVYSLGKILNLLPTEMTGQLCVTLQSHFCNIRPDDLEHKYWSPFLRRLSPKTRERFEDFYPSAPFNIETENLNIMNAYWKSALVDDIEPDDLPTVQWRVDLLKKFGTLRYLLREVRDETTFPTENFIELTKDENQYHTLHRHLISLKLLKLIGNEYAHEEKTKSIKRLDAIGKELESAFTTTKSPHLVHPLWSIYDPTNKQLILENIRFLSRFLEPDVYDDLASLNILSLLKSNSMALQNEGVIQCFKEQFPSLDNAQKYPRLFTFLDIIDCSLEETSFYEKNQLAHAYFGYGRYKKATQILEKDSKKVDVDSPMQAHLLFGLVSFIVQAEDSARFSQAKGYMNTIKKITQNNYGARKDNILTIHYNKSMKIIKLPMGDIRTLESTLEEKLKVFNTQAKK